jgi:hypothetical protein
VLILTAVSSAFRTKRPDDSQEITGRESNGRRTQWNLERTFVFKVDGYKLTGETTSQMMGRSTINDGRVDGDNLSFTITVKFQDNEVKLSYKGKISASGNEIALTSTGIGDAPLELHAKKSS